MITSLQPLFDLIARKSAIFTPNAPETDVLGSPIIIQRSPKRYSWNAGFKG